MKERYEQLNAEKQIFNNELEKNPVELHEEQNKETEGNYYSFPVLNEM